jgi:acetyltransferase-like isoleucine patch superfamily enzyme/coenzyme F420-reducing hydrogenase beta subunit
MIDIKDKQDCCGCNACGDICQQQAISFHTDNEGFWYPVVDKEKCSHCGMCERICPMLHIDELKRNDWERPKVYGGFCKDIVTRFDSTSGGIFSVLAQAMYRQKGYVGGAVYTETFDVKNFISNDKKDLKRLRSSKYLQSNAEGLYKKIKELLVKGEKVLVCGSPCQMAALRQYLQKSYDNLIIADFLCRATNSPKVFHKYLNSLETKYCSKIIAIKDKNKDHGWHSLARKITFEDGQIYYGEGHEDDYRRGYHLNVYERPSCYNCKFKGTPRISDITLGDFWGLQQIDSAMDKNLGTSLIFINSKKGEKFFEQIKDKLECKQYTLEQAIHGNSTAIIGGHLPYPKHINREEFFKSIDEEPFDKCANKYFPYQNPPLNKEVTLTLLHKLKTIFWLARQYKKEPTQLWRMIYWNYLRKEIHSNVTFGRTLEVLSHSVLDIAPTANINIGGHVTFNIKRTRGSKAEFRLLVEDGATLSFAKGVSYFKYDSDIQVFKGAKLLIGNCATNIGLKIVCAELIQIGDDVRIGRDVWIRDNNGGHTVIIKGYKDKAPIIIGNHVWICSNVSITKGVTIGEGAIISANSVVTTNIPAHCIASGNPAKIVAENVIWQP